MRAISFLVAAAASVGGSGQANAAESDGGAALALPIAAAASAWTAALPLFLLREAPAPIAMTFDAGVGGELDLATLGFAVSGPFLPQGRLGWTSRGRANVDVGSSGPEVSGSTRWDTLASVRVTNDDAGPVSLHLLGGAALTLAVDEGAWSAGAGTIVGIRTDVDTTYVQGRIEASYVALFGEPPTGHVHHVELLSQISVSPWPEGSPSVAFFASVKREIGVGETPIYEGATVVGGATITTDTIGGGAR